jgi:hypothetical protein
MASVGRPSKYEQRYCDMLLKDAEQGLSLTAFAGLIGVDRSTIDNWRDQHEEFFLAVKRHAAIRTRVLEQGLLSADMGPRVTARIFALKNAAPEEWKDKVQNEHSSPDGGPLKIEYVLPANHKPEEGYDSGE